MEKEYDRMLLKVEKYEKILYGPKKK